MSKFAATPNLTFNNSEPRVMHIDLNSCFASVEQQANPLLRHKPLAVVHSDTPYGCILAPSVEAKLWGVKTGMTLAEGRELCPWLISRVADPPKYRQIHAQFANLLNDYSDHVVSKSIDEFVLQLPGLIPRNNSPRLDSPNILQGINPSKTTHDIKSRIKAEIGDYLRVSIGVSTNQILAKLASGLHKPDGFDIIDQNNYKEVYGRINLQEFCGINVRNEARLNRVGIFTPLQFYKASRQTLHSAFESVLGDYWHSRLRGYEVDDVEFATKSFGQSYVLPRPMSYEQWRPILAKLVSKAARRLRSAGFTASGIHLSLLFGDHTHWHTGHKQSSNLYSDADLLTAALTLYENSLDRVTAKLQERSVKKIAVTCFGLGTESRQLSCLTDLTKTKALTQALDSLNNTWGEYTVSYGSFMGSEGHVKDAIAFGK